MKRQVPVFLFLFTITFFTCSTDVEASNENSSETIFIFPVSGKIVYNYGWSNPDSTGVPIFNSGIGLSADTESDILAAMDGQVSLTGTNSKYGKFIIVAHSNGYQTFYANLDSFLIQQSDFVKKGDIIGKTGNNSKGESLMHFGLFRDGNPINPINPLDVL